MQNDNKNLNCDEVAEQEYSCSARYNSDPEEQTPDVVLYEHPTTETTSPDKTLVLNLFAGPGAGKSTTAAGVFFELKTLGINCELVTEYAKDLVWEKRHSTFEDQIYLFAKQYHRIFRLLNRVSVVITDCPILLTPIYDYEKRPTLEALVVEEHNKMWTYNAFIQRKKKFNPKGRNHNEDEAKELDKHIMDILWKHRVPFESFEGTVDGKDAIVKRIITLLEKNTK